jgi:hypothetical protein
MMTALLGLSPLTISDGASDYVPKANCTWNITSPPGTRIVLTFSSFDTEMWHDFVVVHNGESRSRFSGAALPPPVVSTGAALRIVFTSDASTQSAGFVATLSLETQPLTPSPSSRPAPTTPAPSGSPSLSPSRALCSQLQRVVLAPGESFMLSDGPANYRPNMNCEWVFVSATTGTKMKLTFNSFQMHPSDMVLVYDGDELRASLANQNGAFPSPILSTGPVLKVVFKSDSVWEAAGFLAEVRASAF